MYKVFYALLCLCLVVNGAEAQIGKTTNYWQWTQGADHHRSLVKIEVIGNAVSDPKLGQVTSRWNGSGTVISGNKILTAAHVMDNGAKFIVTFFDGTKVEATYGVAEPKADVGVLKCAVPPHIPVMKIAPNNPADDTEVELCGFGSGGPLRHFSGTTRIYSGDVLGVDAYVIPGDSGGCILNANKEIVGVISGGIAWSTTKKFSEEGKVVSPTWPTRCGGLEAIQRVSK